MRPPSGVVPSTVIVGVRQSAILSDVVAVRVGVAVPISAAIVRARVASSLTRVVSFLVGGVSPRDGKLSTVSPRDNSQIVFYSVLGLFLSLGEMRDFLSCLR